MHWLLCTLIIGTIPGLPRRQPAHSFRAEGRFVLLLCPPQCLPLSFCETQDSPMRWGHASDPWAPVRITWRAWALRWQAPSRDFSRFESALQISTQVTLLLLVQARTLRTPVLEWPGGKVTTGELLGCAGSMLTGRHPLFPLCDFHRAVRATWLIQPSRGMGVTSPQNLQHVLPFPLLLLQVALIHSLGFLTSSEERPESPVLPVSAAQTNNEMQHKPPNTAFRNEAAEERSNSLKRHQSLTPHPKLKVLSLPGFKKFRNQGLKCSGDVIETWPYRLKGMLISIFWSSCW